MSTIPTLKTGTPIDNPDSCVLNVNNDVRSISTPDKSKKDFVAIVEKDNNDMSPTVNKRSSGTTLVSLTKTQIKKCCEKCKYFCWIYLFHYTHLIFPIL